MKYRHLFILSVLLIVALPVKAKSFNGLFGDITVIDASDRPLTEDSLSGVLDFYLVHEFNNHLSGLLEFVYENSAVDTKTDLERFSLKYSFHQRFNLAIGRFHTPLGNINRAQHHGTFLQEMVTRPFFLEYHKSNSTLPLHVVGFMADGMFRRNSLNIAYESTLHSNQAVNQESNQSGLIFIKLDPNDNLSGSINPGFSSRIRVFPDQKNWQVAAFIYQNETEFDLNNLRNLLDETIVGLDFQYTHEQWKLMAEFFHIRHDYHQTSNRFGATAYFLQAGYRYSDKIGLHYRYAFMHIDENDPYYGLTILKDQHRNSVAIRYELNEYNALKLELEYLVHENSSIENITSIGTQWSFLFH
ncbi:MAG: hypothetical protein IIB69_01665 [Proteobacteria bacterium]|nr:hypothetical protein [Pseudomonadota bacterium]